ncbi:DUF883 family protein [Candidatus Accumulibacter sp. ACC003]|uniref:DUF883 family protein n=1 Tax=Candidatus Accumulibacter sp. ACC003 TaxID=2823334 RepID=UPI0025BC4807|nr:DUF883 family protein [Candidatus Accumulibacter sp. ACC003]
MNTELIAQKGTIESTKHKLVADIRSVAEDADHLLKKASTSTTEGWEAARTQIGAKLSEARSRLDDARIAVTDNARSAAGSTNEYAEDNPWKVAGLALAVGLLIGVLSSRR